MPVPMMGSRKFLYLDLPRELLFRNLTKNDGSALFTALTAKDPTFADCLLKEGADYQIHAKIGNILHVAALYSNVACLQVLRSHKLHGLRIDTRNASGQTALDRAESRTDVDDKWLMVWQELIHSVMDADLDTGRDAAVDTGMADHDTDTGDEDDEFADALEEIET